MDNQKIGFFSKLAGSIKDFGLYPTLARLSVGKAIVYLLLLCLLVTFVIHIPRAINAVSLYNEAGEGLKNLPDFEISNGRLTFSGDMPYYFVNDPQVNVEIIIDTTGATQQTVLNQYDTGILFTETQMISKDNTGQITSVDFEYLPNFSLDGLASIIPLLIIIGFPLLFVGSFIWMFIAKLINALVVSLLALIFNSSLQAGLKWENLFKVSIYAITLPTILVKLINMFSFRLPGQGFLLFLAYYLLAGFWLYKAIQAIHADNQEPEIPAEL